MDHFNRIISLGNPFPLHRLWNFHEHFNTLDYMDELEWISTDFMKHEHTMGDITPTIIKSWMTFG